MQYRIDFATAVEDIVRPTERKEQLVHAQDNRLTVFVGHSGQPGQIWISPAGFGIEGTHNGFRNYTGFTA